MAKFTDLTGRQWEFAINVLQLKRVREATSFELSKLLNDEMKRLKELVADPELFCRVLYVLCDAKGRSVSEEEFFTALAGDPLYDAYQAFEAAYVDFSPSHRRQVLRAMAAKEAELQTILTENVIQDLNAIDPKAVIQTLRNSAGSSPASSESIPAG